MPLCGDTPPTRVRECGPGSPDPRCRSRCARQPYRRSAGPALGIESRIPGRPPRGDRPGRDPEVAPPLHPRAAREAPHERTALRGRIGIGPTFDRLGVGAGGASARGARVSTPGRHDWELRPRRRRSATDPMTPAASAADRWRANPPPRSMASTRSGPEDRPR